MTFRAVGFVAMLALGLMLSAPDPARAAPPPQVVASPAATPAPEATATASPEAFVEFGWTSDQLSNQRGVWNEGALLASYKEASGFAAYAAAATNQRFSKLDDSYDFGVYLPVSKNRSNVNFDVGFSPQHNILPAEAFAVNLDARSGGGYGYQLALSERNYTAVTASGVGAGVDRYWGNQRLQYMTNFVTLSQVPGVAFLQIVRWQLFAPRDTLSLTASGGREVENTGLSIAAYRSALFDVDDVHWFDPTTAIHVGVGYYALSPEAYNRFEARLALRRRI
jgi:YaiO family outer membrane protein